jgi:hypothetical protein
LHVSEIGSCAEWNATRVRALRRVALERKKAAIYGGRIILLLEKFAEREEVSSLLPYSFEQDTFFEDISNLG